MRTRQAAGEIQTVIRTAFEAADLAPDSYAIVADPAKAPALLAGGQLVAVLNVPSQEFRTWSETEATWALWLISGPRMDLPAAWDRLDAATDALAVPLGLDTATPDTFTDLQNATYPAFVLAFTTSHSQE